MSFAKCLPRTAARGLSRRYVHSEIDLLKNHAAIHPSAGIIVIGNELLKAQVKDVNSYFASKCLYGHGVNVKKISVVSDNAYEIAREIQEFAAKYKYVITSGGIGPTHDDVTFQGLAIAFEDKLHPHPMLVDIIKKHFGYKDKTSPAMKMAQIPTKAELKFGQNTDTGLTIPYPCVVLNNVHVFPGTPTFFRMSFESLYKTLFPRALDFHTSELFINANEESFANILATVAKDYPHVLFGSYPECSRFYKTRVTIESNSAKDTTDATNKLKSLIPNDVVVLHDRRPHEHATEKFDAFLKRLSPEQQALYKSTFANMLKRYYRPGRTTVYFDGSEESVLLIHLARMALTKIGLRSPVQIVCFHDDVYGNQNLSNFLRNLIDRYNLDTYTLPNDTGLFEIIRDLSLQRSDLRFLIVGMRETDPSDKIVDRMASFGEVGALKIVSPLQNLTKQDVKLISEGLFLPYYEGAERKAKRS